MSSSSVSFIFKDLMTNSVLNFFPERAKCIPWSEKPWNEFCQWRSEIWCLWQPRLCGIGNAGDFSANWQLPIVRRFMTDRKFWCPSFWWTIKSSNFIVSNQNLRGQGNSVSCALRKCAPPQKLRTKR
jgi:hypothetical protein